MEVLILEKVLVWCANDRAQGTNNNRGNGGGGAPVLRLDAFRVLDGEHQHGVAEEVSNPNGGAINKLPLGDLDI